MEFPEFAIDDTSPVPAYYQIYEAMRDSLAQMAAGTRLPSERDLATHFGVTRGTLRQALDRLENDRLISRRQGSGTRVSQPRVVHDARVLSGFTSEYQSHGFDVRSKVLSLKVVKTPPHVVFEGVENAQAVELRRVRYVGPEPISLETVWLPAATSAELLHFNPPFTSLYSALAELGIVPVRGIETLNAVTLDAFQAQLLEQRPGTAAFVVDRRTFDNAGTSVEQVTTFIRADRFSLTTEIHQTTSAQQRSSS